MVDILNQKMKTKTQDVGKTSELLIKENIMNKEYYLNLRNLYHPNKLY